VRLLLITAIAFLTISTATHAADSVFNNLSGITSAELKIYDHTNLLSENDERKLFNSLRLQLRSAGLKVENQSDRGILIELNHIPSTLAGHRVNATIKMVEQVVIQNRDTSKTAIAITYLGSTMFKSSLPSEAVEHIEQSLFAGFIDQYLNDN